MRFVKLHGYGNDYLVFEAGQLAGVGALDELARRVCDRHYGAGADGVAVVEPLPEDSQADFSLRIFNADGGEAAMSGNGSRSAVSYLYFEGLWSEEHLRLKTRAGIKAYRLLEQDRERGQFRFVAEIGRPVFASAAVPMLIRGGAESLERVVAYPLELAGGETVRITALQMCNPNVCVIVDDFERTDWRRLGQLIEQHPQFPERTNVEFIRVLSPERVEARVWERGVGETLSSGTGACASAVAACLNGLTKRRVTVEMPGGQLEVEWREADDEVLLTGTAEVVYRGEWLREGMRAEG